MAITHPSVEDERVVEVAARLRVAIFRTARRLRQEAGAELGPALIAALGTIERHGPLTPSELADLERVKRPSRLASASRTAPNSRRYFAGQLVSLSGNWTQVVAEMWLILTLTGSGLAVGVTSALQFLPLLLFGAWGGLLADRFPKRSLL